MYLNKLASPITMKELRMSEALTADRHCAPVPTGFNKLF